MESVYIYFLNCVMMTCMKITRRRLNLYNAVRGLYDIMDRLSSEDTDEFFTHFGLPKELTEDDYAVFRKLIINLQMSDNLFFAYRKGTYRQFITTTNSYNFFMTPSTENILTTLLREYISNQNNSEGTYYTLK